MVINGRVSELYPSADRDGEGVSGHPPARTHIVDGFQSDTTSLTTPETPEAATAGVSTQSQHR